MFFCYNKPVWRNSMWKIGNVEIDNQVVLAPMAGISNSAYRRICKDKTEIFYPRSGMAGSRAGGGKD